MPDTPTALYKYFDDAGRLLYIGITGDLANREQGHIGSSRWMELTASSTVQRYPSREDALKVEREAIEAEHPVSTASTTTPRKRGSVCETT